MSEFERINTGRLLLRDVDMARFFVKYAKENAKYLLKEDENNISLYDFYVNISEMELSLESYFELMKKELNVEMDNVEERRMKKRKKRKSKKK